MDMKALRISLSLVDRLLSGVKHIAIPEGNRSVGRLSQRTGTVPRRNLADRHLPYCHEERLGCGTTTLLNCLSGCDSLNSVTVIVDGTDINALNDHAGTLYRARQMGFVFQATSTDTTIGLRP